MAFFVLLLFVLGAGMAIGRGSADVMFLKRYGIEFLPVMYLILSLVLAVCFTLYAAFVDRISSERFFYFLLSIETLVLLAFWYAIYFADMQLAYPAYYIFYELVSELILVHATFYVAQSLDTLQSKRLTALILAGYQTGMIAGGLFFAVMMPSIGVEHAMLIWSGLLLLSLFMLFMWHKKHGVSPFFMPPSKSSGRQIVIAVQEVMQGIQFVRQSALLKNASYALFFMVLMFYVLTYSVNKIYTENFESEADLALFFGMLVAGTNFLAVILQAFVSGRVIEKIGVRKAKLIYPALTVVSYILLLISPGFYMALIASVNNSSVMPAFRNSTRQMFFNVLPDYVRGRARATSVALVLPLALFVCGILILYLQTSENPTLIIYFGFFCALMYWLFCYRMGNVYSSTLIENLKGKLYLPSEITDAAYRGNSESLYPVLIEGLGSEDNKVCVSYTALLIKTFPEKAVEPIMLRIKSAQTDIADRLIRVIGNQASESVLSELMLLADSEDDHLKATIYDVVLKRSRKDYRSIIETALLSAHGRIRASGIKAAINQRSGELYQRGLTAWGEQLQGDREQQMAVIDMQPLLVYVGDPQRLALETMYTKAVVSLLRQADVDRRKTIYRAMSRWTSLRSEHVYEQIIQDIKNVDSVLRCAATACLHKLPEDQGRSEYIWQMMADGHDGVRKAALAEMGKLYELPATHYFEWLMEDNTGTPRAQKTLLAALIKHGIERSYLKQLVDKKTKYATELLSALSVFSEKDDVRLKMIRTVLEERLTEMIDLILLAIEPTMEAGIIAVIRAGLSSKNVNSVASAYEALQGIEDQRLAALLSDLIDRNHDKATKRGQGKCFSTVHEVLQWCIGLGDVWLRECSDNTLMLMDQKSYA